MADAQRREDDRSYERDRRDYRDDERRRISSRERYARSRSPRDSRRGDAQVELARRAAELAAPDELKRIAALEIFDDPDQFALIMSHYCLVFAASGACVPLVGACSGG